MVQDSVVFKADRVVIPPTLRPEMMDRVHAAHIGARPPAQSQRRHFLAWNEQGLGDKDSLLRDLPYA